MNRKDHYTDGYTDQEDGFEPSSDDPDCLKGYEDSKAVEAFTDKPRAGHSFSVFAVSMGLFIGFLIGVVVYGVIVLVVGV